MNFAGSSPPINEALKLLRGRTTLDEMATKVGVSRATVVNYESGKRAPDQSYLAAFAEATGADFLELLRLRLASSDDEPAQRMAERLQAAPSSEAAQMAAAEVHWRAIPDSVRYSGVTEPGATNAAPVVDIALLTRCVAACGLVYGRDFAGLDVPDQVAYAADLYNRLVRLADSSRMTGAQTALLQLEVAGMADQLRLFIKMGMAKQFNPRQAPPKADAA